MVRLATRKSPLALWQANFVKSQLEQYAEVSVELLPMTTKGDQLLDQSLSMIGGKGLFLKELQHAILDGSADIAVHSMKDVPVIPTTGLTMGAICQRDDAHDVLVSQSGDALKALPKDAIVGTASVRRRAQLLAWRDDLQIKILRGNVSTRLEKLKKGEYDAIILASAGLHRLGQAECISDRLTLPHFIPAVGQGAIGVECRSDDDEIKALLASINHYPTQVCVEAERTFSRCLQGDCGSPLAAHAYFEQETLHMSAMVACRDGSNLLRSEKQGSVDSKLGEQLAEILLAQGAADILREERMRSRG